MSEMVERVARAIWNNPAKCDLRNVSAGPCGLNDECACWPLMQNVARAAIETMREPTQAMRDGGGRCNGTTYGSHTVVVDPTAYYQAMIDAALAQPPVDG